MPSNDLTYSAFESRYRDRQYIGSGGFAKVYKVFDYARNHYVAIKIADVKPEWNKFTLKNEVELVNKLPFHRNIARYDACYRFNTGSFTGEMDFAILRFYEYGNLEQFLKKQKISLDDKRFIIQGILGGIAFLHNNNVIHRDLKAQNILLHREDGVWTPKITDFGLSREILKSGNITNSAIGISYAYAAPEQIMNKKIYKNVDLWAVGVIIYRILAEELPFKGRPDGDDRSTQSQLELSRKIINLELPAALNTITEPYQGIIRRCLVLDPEERVQSAEELMQMLNEPIEKPRGPELEPEHTVTIQQPNEELLQGDKTELVQKPDEEPKPDPEQQPVYTPPASTSTPPGFPPAPGEEYAKPKPNVTQVIENKPVDSGVESEPPPGYVFQPNTGDPQRRFRWLWIIAFLLLIGGGGGGYYWYFNQGEFQIFKPTETSTSTVPALVIKDRFVELDREIDNSRTSKPRLLSLGEDLSNLVQVREHANNYRLPYLQAKVLAYTDKNPRLSFKALIEAAELAIVNGDANRMLLDLQKDESGAFENTKKYQKNWTRIIQSLEEAR